MSQTLSIEFAPNFRLRNRQKMHFTNANSGILQKQDETIGLRMLNGVYVFILVEVSFLEFCVSF